MKKAMMEICSTWTRVLGQVPRTARKLFTLAVVIMAVSGALAAVPAVVIGRLVDDMLVQQYDSFVFAIPYLAIVILAVVLKEALTVCRKWLVEDAIGCLRL